MLQFGVTNTPPPPAASRLRLRLALVATGAVVAGLAGWWQLDRLFVGGLDVPIDFAEYWTAGYLNAAGHNPYSGANVRAVQRQLGFDGTAIMMWNPPWALTLVMPVGALPFRAAYGAWALANLILVVAAAELLWRGFGGPPRLRWVAYVAALTFAPTAYLIGGGQITGVALFGLAGFLHFTRTGRPVLAGACAALAAVKPHLLALFALWLLVGATRSAAGRKILLGGLLAGLAACVPPTLANPHVWEQYLAATRGPSSADHYHVSDWNPPVVGWWLRQAAPGRPFAVQWVPLGLAVVAFLAWWRRTAPPAEAPDALPWLVGFSLLAAPYGGWSFDLVLLLVPLLAVAARVVRSPTPPAVAALVLLLVGVSAIQAAMMAAKAPSQAYVWFTPVVLLGCAAVPRLLVPAPAPLPAGARA